MVPLIWQRYFLQELFKTFLFFLLCVFFLYSLIDFSTNYQDFSGDSLSIFKLLRHYAYHFLKRLEVLVPFAVLISSIRCAAKFNTSNELVSLLSGGIPMRKLLQPFLILGLFGTFCLYINYEFGTPKAMQKLQIFKDSSETPQDEKNPEKLFAIKTDGDSILIFQKYDFSTRLFKQVYGILGTNKFFYASTLFPHAREAIGQKVDWFERNEENEIELTERHDTYIFRDFKLSEDKISEIVLDEKMRSISQLIKLSPSISEDINDQDAELLAALYHKLFVPWISFFLALLPFPFCVRFNRNFSLFPIYSVSIFLFVFVFAIIDACYILGKSSLYDPFSVMVFPFLVLIALSFWTYSKIK